MLGGQLIVCESSGSWAVGLRRVLRRDRWRVIETRSVDDCWQQLAREPTSIIAWEGTLDGAETVAEQLIEQSRSFPRSPGIVVCRGRATHDEWLWREAGAVHVVRSPRELPSILGMARRHGIRFPAQQRSLEETIWRQLPVWRSIF